MTSAADVFNELADVQALDGITYSATAMNRPLLVAARQNLRQAFTSYANQELWRLNDVLTNGPIHQFYEHPDDDREHIQAIMNNFAMVLRGFETAQCLEQAILNFANEKPPQVRQMSSTQTALQHCYRRIENEMRVLLPTPGENGHPATGLAYNTTKTIARMLFKNRQPTPEQNFDQIGTGEASRAPSSRLLPGPVANDEDVSPRVAMMQGPAPQASNVDLNLAQMTWYQRFGAGPHWETHDCLHDMNIASANFNAGGQGRLGT